MLQLCRWKFSHKETLQQTFYSIEIEFYLKTTKNRSLSQPLGNFNVTYALHLQLVGKPVVDFIFVMIELFFHVLRLRSYGTVICRSRRFFEGWVTLNANFRRKGSSPTDHCWCQKTRVTALSCGIKISAVHCLILSQSTRVTDGQTDGQNFESQDRATIVASRGKNAMHGKINIVKWIGHCKSEY